MWIECIVVFLWMTAVYASIYRWHIKSSDDVAGELRFLSMTAFAGVTIAVVADKFSREVMGFSLAAILAISVVILYAYVSRRVANLTN